MKSLSVYYEKVRVKVTCKIECNLPSFSVDRLLCDFWRYSLKGYTNAFMSIVHLKSNKLQVKLSKSLSSYHILKAIYNDEVCPDDIDDKRWVN